MLFAFLNAVHTAAQTGNIEMLKFLVQRGADYKEVDDKGRIATFSSFVANQQSMMEIIEYLVNPRECGLDINAVGRDGHTSILLEAAIDSKRLTPEFTEFLLSHGADLEQKALNGKTAYEIIMECCSNAEVKRIVSSYWKTRQSKKKVR